MRDQYEDPMEEFFVMQKILNEVQEKEMRLNEERVRKENRKKLVQQGIAVMGVITPLLVVALDKIWK